MRKIIVLGVPLLILLSLMLLFADVTHAGTDISTDVLHAWDYSTARYENGNARIIHDGSWVSFQIEVGFDSDVWPDDYEPVPDLFARYDPCGEYSGTSTPWAGNLEISLYHTDNNPAGAPGFQQTQNWALYECDRDGDGDRDVNDFSVAPPTVWLTPTTWYSMTLFDQDFVQAAGCGGNCQDQIFTTVLVNTDKDCDGNIDVPLPPSGLCLYWEAQTPVAPPATVWGGNIQGRVQAGTGDKTINFGVVGQTAVTLDSLTAHSPAGPYVAALLGVSIGGVVLLYWRSRRRKP